VGDGARPENVVSVTAVFAAPSDGNMSDLVGNLGQTILGVPSAFQEGADTTITVDANHEDFGGMYTSDSGDTPSAADAVDSSYECTQEQD